MATYHPILKPTTTTSTLRTLYTIILISILCIISYTLGTYRTSTTLPRASTSSPRAAISPPCSTITLAPTKPLDFTAHHSNKSLPHQTLKPHPPCDPSLTEHTPCEDTTRSLSFPREKLIYRERHCPSRNDRLQCRIPAPYSYKTPFKWPMSRDMAWYANVPHKELTIEKAVQNWIRYEGDTFRFPGGGTMFPHGADAYIDNIGKLINLRDGSIRTAVDTGCGVISRFIFFFPPRLIYFYFLKLIDFISVKN